MKRFLYFGLGLILVLLGYGIFRFPRALSLPSGLIGDCVVLIICVLVIRFWIPALENQNN